MRQVLADHARAHGADKRGQRAAGGRVEGSAGGQENQEVDLIAFEDTLTKLVQVRPCSARKVESAHSPSVEGGRDGG
jgi:hypothetical protein